MCIALALAAIVGCHAEAQTAPQLLPYTAKLIAGGGPTATYKAGSLCPVSGFTETDAYGDGCLANEIILVSPRYAIADGIGDVFFSDYTNGLVRRVDASTGVVTAVVGGAATTPTAGTTCGSLKSTDIFGDGCLGTAVKISHPTGLAFDANGDLFFSDYGYSTVREVTATNGFITTTGVVTLVAGNTSSTSSNYGYNVNNTAASGLVNAATQSYVNDPYGLAFDCVRLPVGGGCAPGTAGNLYIADEGNNAVEVINLTGASETVQGLTVPAGTIAKVIGYGTLNKTANARSGDCPDFVSTSLRGGCYYATTFTGTTGVTANIDGNYSVAVDGSSNLYVTNEFNANSGAVTPANNIYNFTGEAGTAAEPNVTTRAAAGTFAVGSDFGIAADTNSNVYVGDASSGLIWRVDGPFSPSGGQSMYVVAGGVGNTGGPTAVCAGATDKYGDGCPALQAQLGSSGSKTTFFASSTAPGPGVYGITVDAFSDLFFADTEAALIREIASGTQFGVVGANQPTNTVDIHFATGDTPSTTNPYQITVGSANFSVGTATCTTNSDKTADCLLPVTATPTVLGAFTGTLQVTSALGRVSNFTLNGIYAQSQFTRTTLSYTAGASCTGTTTYAASTPITLTANVIANGPAPPVGSADTITFYANNGTTNTAIGTVPVSNLGTSTTPSYGATLTYTFPATGTYTFTAVYSGDSYFKSSTGQSAATVTIATPSYTVTAISNMQSTVAQGQTALYSFTVNQNVYSGTINFAVTGLPANSSYTMSPTSITASGCSGTSTVTLSILTTPQPPSNVASIGAAGHGPWAFLSLFSGLGLALFIGLRRRHMSARLGQLCMMLALLIAASGLMACNTLNVSAPAATPKGSYTITVTATGSAGGSGSVPFPLTVN